MFRNPLIRKSPRLLSRLNYNELQQRQLLASITAESGAVVVYGDNTDDVIELIGGTDFKSFTVRINSDPSLARTFQYADVTQLTVFAGSGNDRVTSTLLRDSVIYGGIGDDYIEGGYHNDVVFGGDGSDALFGGNGDDTLRGQGGNDRMYGGRGADRLFGFDGNDWLFGGNGNDYLQGDDGNDELHGQDGADQLLGGNDNDRLFGELGDDALAGHNGNDLIVGGPGSDRIEGNAGNDLLNGNEDNDIINAGPGEDTVNGGTGDDAIAGFAGVNSLNGNGGADHINGGKDADTIAGGGGDDFLAGHEGDDVIAGGHGDDRIQGNAGHDLLNGDGGNDRIDAGAGDDTVNGGSGDDVITSAAGTNTLNGNGGHDRIHGGNAADVIRGGSGNDFLAGAEGKDLLIGGDGNDRMFGGADDDNLQGEDGDDFLYGQQGDDFLVGDQGNDVIFGNEGNDEIHASLGDDRISGDSGSDLLYYFSNQNNFRVNRIGENYRVTDLRASDQALNRNYGIDSVTAVEELAIGEKSNTVRRPIGDTVSEPVGVANEIIKRINDVLPDAWTSKVRIADGDIWLRTVKPNGTAHLDFRFGSAGVIAEIRNVKNGRNLLAPSFKGEVTDRVIQWTLWEVGRTVRHDVPSLPEFEDRFNMTQAGTFDNVLNGTVDVDVDQQQGEIDVWSVVDHNWKSEQDPHMAGTITALTRSKVLDGGAILVRRVIRIGEIRLNGKPVSLANPYFEAWNPFSDSEFDSMALSIDASGNPDRWFADGRDIPTYPFIPVQETRGWAMSYHRRNVGGSQNLSVVFGTDKGTVHRADGSKTTSHGFHLNSLDFNGGMAILPGLSPGALSHGAVIDQHMILVPGAGIDAATPIKLDALADLLPPPRIYHAGAEISGDLSAIVDRLSTLNGQRRVATDNLARLI